MGGDASLQTHEHQKQDGRRQLEQELLQRRESQILVALHLLKVVQKADNPENGGKEEQVDMGQIACHHVRPAGGENGGRYAGDEHQSPHGGGTRLGGVPLGPHLPDFLARLQPPEGGQKDPPAQQGRDGKTECASKYHLHRNLPLSRSGDQNVFVCSAA